MPGNAFDTLHLAFGVPESNRAMFRGAQGRFYRAAARMPASIALELDALAARLIQLIKEEFAKHNKTGQSIKTLRVRIQGPLATISMGRGGPFIEFGTGRHVITARPGKVLMFKLDGQTIFRRRVTVRGIQRDPFMQKAAARLDLAGALRRMASIYYAEVTGTAQAMRTTTLYRRGELYSGRATGMGL